MISVCMATYNGSKYIKEQIDSILCQLSADDELIISDDGSKDDTCAIIEGYHDSRIKLLHNKKRHGYVGNFENALVQVKGDYIFLSDQDDVWMQNKVVVMSKYLETYDLVTHNALIVDGEGKSLGKSYFDCMHNRSGFFANFLETRHLGCCMAFNRAVLSKALPFVSYNRGHDYWIGCVADLAFKTIFIGDELVHYRRHGGNASPSSEKSKSTIWKKINKRLDMANALFLRFCHLK